MRAPVAVTIEASKNPNSDVNAGLSDLRTGWMQIAVAPVQNSTPGPARTMDDVICVLNAAQSTLKLLSNRSGGTKTNRMKCGCVCFQPSIEVLSGVGRLSSQCSSMKPTKNIITVYGGDHVSIREIERVSIPAVMAASPKMKPASSYRYSKTHKRAKIPQSANPPRAAHAHDSYVSSAYSGLCGKIALAPPHN